MKALLIVPPLAKIQLGIKYKPTTAHAGLAYLAGMLRKHQHEVAVLDLALETRHERLQTCLNEIKPDLVAVTSMSYQHRIAYDLIKELKTMGNYQVAFGGIHVSAIREKALEDTEADFAILGEGEYTLLELCNGVDYKNIKGLIWRDGEKIVSNEPRELITNLDEIPFPAYDLFKVDEYTDRVIPLVSSRGCPFGCIYCSVDVVFGRKFRARKPENVLEEIQMWCEKGYRYFRFNDDCFTFDAERTNKICEMIIERELKIVWDLQNGIRVDRVDKELLVKMKQAGCRQIGFGVESADEEVLKNLHKGITIEQVTKTIYTAHELGFNTNAFFMIGGPGDTFEKFKKSLKFAKSLPVNEFRFMITTPYPRTKLYDWVDKNAHWLIKSDDYLNECSPYRGSPIFETSEFPGKEVEKAYNIAYKEVMRKIVKNELGNLWGSIAYLFWYNPIIRKVVMKPGIKLWEIIRGRRSRRFSLREGIK
ncbi:MAG: radical SAM protein [bacterium]